MDANYIFLALFISFLWGIQPVIHKHLLTKLNYVTIMLISTIINCSLIIMLAIYRGKEVASDINKLTNTDLFILVCLPIFTVFMANIIYYYILKNHESSLISALIYSSPVFTLIISYLFLSERLDIFGISGVFAIIAGVILVSQNNQSSRQFEFLSNR